MTEYFKDKSLASTPPIKRAAYSDRTAWILAEISRLAYEKLPAEASIENLMSDIEIAVEKGEIKNVLEGLIKSYFKHGDKTQSFVADALADSNFEYINSHSKDGTEVLLCKLNIEGPESGMLVVVFRGTQLSIKDILTDFRANLVTAEGTGRIHAGFNEAFNSVSSLIQQDIQKYPHLPIYMTGHSLGGALALVATRYLCSNTLGATYTYGGPRIADNKFFEDIKTPVYRVVNAADAVPRVPFGHGFNLFTRMLRLVPINGTKNIVGWMQRNFMGYTHYGNMIFLDAPSNEKDRDGLGYKNLKVIKSPSIFIIAPVVVMRYITTLFKAGATDHSISDYCNKLYIYAKRRN